ncbi:MAG TPA: hypothetical protein VK742_13665 [Candidatus Sulfotelmatobacter sp.]|jgi:ElaB/YqjD/DUF883 family membrane-anchored ribosome-binding protein|nr:hypothetical protein [Candidatus Sulfotelmatobacter sp.]
MNTKHAHANHKSHAADLAETVEETAGEAGNRLTAVLENTRQFVGNVRDKAVATAKATDKAVHQNPYKALAIGAGIGIALGFILGRRRGTKEV